jgi:predicted Fe-Mo cluster-binding NifX family protein
MGKIRVAFASSDGVFIDTHFGKCEKFFIADIDGDSKTYEIVETRKCTRMCGNDGHTQENLTKTIKLLHGCSYVIVARIGIWIVSELKQNGITPLEFFGKFDEAVKEINTKGL